MTRNVKIIIILIVGSLLGLALCFAATMNRKTDVFTLLSLNADYTLLGWSLRITGGLIGLICLTTVALALPNIPKRVRYFMLSLSTFSIMWEFAVVAFMLAVVLLAIMGMSS
jgi:hypothetical protein